eukprot:11441143-Alexandrium_andersonii.AAC.1
MWPEPARQQSSRSRPRPGCGCRDMRRSGRAAPGMPPGRCAAASRVAQAWAAGKPAQPLRSR